MNIKQLNEELENIIADNNTLEDEDKKQYYYIVDAHYSTPGYYYDSDTNNYTDEGDTYGYDGEETSKLYTWQELLWELDDERLLEDVVPDEPPTEVIREENGHKVIFEYDVEKEEEWEAEYGHFEERDYRYEIQICRR